MPAQAACAHGDLAVDAVVPERLDQGVELVLPQPRGHVADLPPARVARQPVARARVSTARVGPLSGPGARAAHAGRVARAREGCI